MDDNHSKHADELAAADAAQIDEFNKNLDGDNDLTDEGRRLGEYRIMREEAQRAVEAMRAICARGVQAPENSSDKKAEWTLRGIRAERAADWLGRSESWVSRPH